MPDISLTSINSALEKKMDGTDSSSNLNDVLRLANAADDFTSTVFYDSSGGLPTNNAFIGTIARDQYGTVYIYDGTNWTRPNQAGTIELPFFQGSNYGYVIGGNGGITAVDRYSFSADGNATDVGDLKHDEGFFPNPSPANGYVGQGIRMNAGASSSTNGYTMGGFSYGFPVQKTNHIGRFPFASNGNVIDIANLTFSRTRITSSSSETYGYAAGGSSVSGGPAGHPEGGSSGTNRINVIDKFPFSSDDNATDVGDLTEDLERGAGLSSRDFGYAAGGRKDPSPAIVNVIERWSHTADENSADVGDLTAATELAAGISATTVGYSTGGSTDKTIIEKFTFASSANSTDVGTLTQGAWYNTGTSSTVSGYVAGGLDPSNTSLNTIQKFPFAADTASTDVGDLVSARYEAASAQY